MPRQNILPFYAFVNEIMLSSSFSNRKSALRGLMSLFCLLISGNILQMTISQADSLLSSVSSYSSPSPSSSVSSAVFPPSSLMAQGNVYSRPQSKAKSEAAKERAQKRKEAREQELKKARELQMSITPAMVQNAIEGGVEFLKSAQHSTGGWKEEEIHVGGVSALCALALLNAGVPADDPHMVRALNFLRKIDPTSGPVESNYVAALQTMVFCMAEPEKDAGLIRRNVMWFIKEQKEKGTRIGSWGYPYGDGDPSNSQFTLLALYEADQLGLTIPEDVWRKASRYWERIQNMDGSWSYYFFPPEMGRQSVGSGSMTCAGIVSLLIAAEKSELADARIEGDQFLPCQRQTNDLTKRMSHAQKWMADHFSVTRNPGNKDWLLYYLYGLERMGRMTEQRFIGGHDWYREGTAHLLRLAQTVAHEDKMFVYWEGTTASEKLKPIGTSLALLFLSKGRYPVLMTKVRFTKDSEDWNWHRHDISHLARFVERKWEKHVTTQTVDLEDASVEDLLLSPVLFISGKDSPCPKDPILRQQFGEKLRDYVERGGFIVAESVCSGGTFDQGMRELLKEIFPEDQQHLYLMPPEHPIWSAETAIPPKYVRPIYCLDYGCRTCFLFLPSEKESRPSLSCLWELAPEMRQGKLHSAAVKKEILAGMNLGLNILSYVTNRELRGKEESFANTLSEENVKQPEEAPYRRGRLTAANLRHGGGCEATPQALRNLLLGANGFLKNPAGILEETILASSERIFEFPVLFLQGRYALRFTPREKDSLRTYLERGGILFANSICGAKAFDETFQKEIKQILPEAKLEKIPLSDPLCTGVLGGFDLSRIQTRQAVQNQFSEKKQSIQSQPLELWGIRLNGRWAVVYSPLDLSCALERHPSAGCVGYSPEDAAKIGINVLLYSMQ